MTIAIDNSGGKVLYTSNGVQTQYGFGFKVLNVNDIKVYEDGVISTANIQFNLNLDQDAMPGGTIDYLTSTEPVNGVIILIKRIVSIEQQTDYTQYGGFPAETHELALDNLTQIVQGQSEEFSRTIKASIDDDGTTDFTLPPYEADKAIKWNSITKKLENSNFNPDSSGDASASAAAALVSENNAAASEVNTAADAVSTAADRVSTNADAALAASAIASTAADKAATNADAAQTALDKASTNADALATAADKIATNADAASTAADALTTAADRVATNQDTIDTAADLAATNNDTIQTANDVTVSGNNATNSVSSAAAALISENNAASSAASAGAAAGLILIYPVTSGTSTAYTLSSGINAPVSNTTYKIRIHTSNTANNNATLNFDATGAISIKLLNGSNPYIGAMKADSIGEFYYNGTNFILTNPSGINPILFASSSLGAAITSFIIVPFNVIIRDTNNNYNTGTYRYLPTEPGYYKISVQIPVINVVSGDSLLMFVNIDSITVARKNVIASATTEFLTIEHIAPFNGTSIDLWIGIQNQTRTTSSIDSDILANFLMANKIGDI